MIVLWASGVVRPSLVSSAQVVAPVVVILSHAGSFSAGSGGSRIGRAFLRPLQKELVEKWSLMPHSTQYLLSVVHSPLACVRVHRAQFKVSRFTSMRSTGSGRLGKFLALRQVSHPVVHCFLEVHLAHQDLLSPGGIWALVQKGVQGGLPPVIGLSVNSPCLLLELVGPFPPVAILGGRHLGH